jgi:hypothetical protein
MDVAKQLDSAASKLVAKLLQECIISLVKHRREWMGKDNGGETMRHASITKYLDVDPRGLEGFSVSESVVAEDVNARAL